MRNAQFQPLSGRHRPAPVSASFAAASHPASSQDNTDHRLISVMVIQRLPRRSHKQFAWVKGHNRSTLTRNLNERSVIVHTTPLGRVNCLSTNRNDRKDE